MRRLKPDARKAMAVNVGLVLAETRGLGGVSIAAAAAAMGVSAPALNYHFKTASAFRDAVVAEAVRTWRRSVVAHAIVAQHPAVAGLSAGERAEALGAF